MVYSEPLTKYYQEKIIGHNLLILHRFWWPARRRVRFSCSPRSIFRGDCAQAKILGDQFLFNFQYIFYAEQCLCFQFNCWSSIQSNLCIGLRGGHVGFHFHKGRHTQGDTCGNMKRGHVAATIFLAWHPRFCEKVLLRGHNFVPATCCMKFSWFKFVRPEARM